VTAHAGIVTREVSYPAGSVTARGFLAAPEGEGKHPGVLVVHEWWGLNDYARERAEKLAALGYVALAVDMYGEGKVAGHPKDAGAFAGAVMKDLPEARKRFEAALSFLAKQPEVDSGKLAAIGYCFGGGVVLQMACDGVPGLLAVASFHGSLGAEVPPGVKPTAKVLVCHGDDDTFVKPEALHAFKDRMKAAGVDLTFVSYPGAKHGFTNPDADKSAKEFGLNIGYNAKADKESWKELQAFLKKSLKN
jgi:dienelactone hydrolase